MTDQHKSITYRAEFFAPRGESWLTYGGRPCDGMTVQEMRQSEENIRACIAEVWDMAGRYKWRIIQRTTEWTEEIIEV